MTTPLLDAYATLKVAKDADTAAIRKSYLQLAKQTHPDRFQDLDEQLKAKVEFQKIQEAWSAIGDPVERAKYDDGLRRASRHRASYADHSAAPDDMYGDRYREMPREFKPSKRDHYREPEMSSSYEEEPESYFFSGGTGSRKFSYDAEFDSRPAGAERPRDRERERARAEKEKGERLAREQRKRDKKRNEKQDTKARRQDMDAKSTRLDYEDEPPKTLHHSYEKGRDDHERKESYVLDEIRRRKYDRKVEEIHDDSASDNVRKFRVKTKTHERRTSDPDSASVRTPRSATFDSTRAARSSAEYSGPVPGLSRAQTFNGQMPSFSPRPTPTHTKTTPRAATVEEEPSVRRSSARNPRRRDPRDGPPRESSSRSSKKGPAIVDPPDTPTPSFRPSPLGRSATDFLEPSRRSKEKLRNGDFFTSSSPPSLPRAATFATGYVNNLINSLKISLTVIL
jgi:curved DNA-binding protein CbpA